ncbi:hypothetical protein [Phreatobacter sp. AB_2022a]|uniref:hypothetical protein n=1 Tax=Phreatobacter sp. AB_2022a TaxID=3003134 RepID=UPI002286ED6F|nr:hypothetical protein [Phreatobacter sp. AB_2022a]MCZ0736972.1 hypothetical protein [Phreatobacter sp. AB_2022a]
MASAATPEVLVRGYMAALAETLLADEAMHRLWYDIGGPSMFEAQFRADVDDIDGGLEHTTGRIMTRYAPSPAAAACRAPRSMPLSTACSGTA